MDATESKISLANLALIKMGAKVITSFADGSISAQVISLIYDQCREHVLEEHPWSFATKTATLSQLAFTPTDFGDGASIAYALPADYLKAYMVNQPSALIRQEIINGQVAWLSDTPGLILKYIFNNDDPTTYTAKFIDALACKIAKEGCFKLIEANQNATKLEQDYQNSLLSAMAEDSKSSSPDEPFQDEFLLARLSGSSVIVGKPNGNIGFLGPGWPPGF